MPEGDRARFGRPVPDLNRRSPLRQRGIHSWLDRRGRCAPLHRARCEAGRSRRGVHTTHLFGAGPFPAVFGLSHPRHDVFTHRPVALRERDGFDAERPAGNQRARFGHSRMWEGVRPLLARPVRVLAGYEALPGRTRERLVLALPACRGRISPGTPLMRAPDHPWLRCSRRTRTSNRPGNNRALCH